MRHFLALMLLCFAALPARAQVTEFRLENGLQVVVIEDHRAPVVTHMVWYRVGSADDPPGKSGLSHFLEHLMFDGTDRLAPGEFSRIVTRNGGQGNAFTSFDYTGYFQRVAADRLPLMMELEADRMANLVIDRATVAEERAVVLEERGLRVDANPGAIISERERAALFLHHPYRIPIIGWRHEIEGLTADDAQAFYRRHYAPDNAILIVAGDVTPDAVRALAREHYGPIPAAGVTPRARVQEPPHIAARRVTYADARVTQPSVSRGYLAPSRRSGAQAEAAALSLFTRLLGRGPTSHLYRTLVVEEGVAVAAGAGYSPLGLGPSALSVYAVPAQGVGLEEIEARLDAALSRFWPRRSPPAIWSARRPRSAPS